MEHQSKMQRSHYLSSDLMEEISEIEEISEEELSLANQIYFAEQDYSHLQVFDAPADVPVAVVRALFGLLL
jgi:hypothetical protein